MKDASSVIPEGQLSRQSVEEGNPIDGVPPGMYFTAKILNVGFTVEPNIQGEMNVEGSADGLNFERMIRNSTGQVIGTAYRGGRFENFESYSSDVPIGKEGDVRVMDVNSAYPFAMMGLTSDE